MSGDAVWNGEYPHNDMVDMSLDFFEVSLGLENQDQSFWPTVVPWEHDV